MGFGRLVMTKAILIVFVISLMALWENVNCDEGLNHELNPSRFLSSFQQHKVPSPTPTGSPARTSPTSPSPDQQEMTFDEVIKGSKLIDADRDGIPNGDDNCPGVANADQKDTNRNGIGDACEHNLTTPSRRKRNKNIHLTRRCAKKRRTEKNSSPTHKHSYSTK